MVSWRECLRLQTERELTEEHKEQKMMRLMQVALVSKTSLIGCYAVLELLYLSHPGSNCKAVNYHICFGFCCKTVQ